MINLAKSSETELSFYHSTEGHIAEESNIPLILQFYDFFFLVPYTALTLEIYSLP